MTKRRTWGTLLSLIATVIVLFAFCGITVLADDTEDSDPEIVAQGYCGDRHNELSVSWVLDSNGLLTISGTGRMRDITAPWLPNRDAIKKVVIGEGVTSIGNNAFRNCTSLASITIPDSVYKIGDSAFEGCSLLSAITIPDRVTSIGNNVFRNCTSLASITIPDRVTSIGNDAFRGCTSLTSITIPNSVTSIGDNAFRDCTSLISITIPDSVTSIGDEAFRACTSLTSITIPDSVTSIGDEAFRDCTSLTSITIPDSVTSIGNDVFYGCTSLNKVQGKFVVLGSSLHLYGYSLSLDGSIGVNFYMKLSDEVLNNDSTAFMRFTVNGKEQNVPVKDLTPNKDGYYIFRCDVVAKEMADEITAQVYIDENNPIGDAYTYSVREYAAYILDHPEKYSVNAIELVKAMLNYGAAAQNYFGYGTDDLANSILPADGQQTSLSVGDLEYYKDGEISPAKISLSLKSTITLKLYFKTEDVDGVKFEYKKQELKTTVSGEYTIVIIEGIPATNFSSKLSIKYYIGESTEAKTLKYRASNYACIVLKQENGGVITDELKEVLVALHIFSAAAIEYNSVLPA